LYKSKNELQRVQNYLKTAQFIIELLQKEVGSKSEQESSGTYIHCTECGEYDTDGWRQVRVSQATKKRVNLPPITDYCVQTANRYAVLNNLQEPMNYFPKSRSFLSKCSKWGKEISWCKTTYHSTNRRQSRKGHCRKTGFTFGLFVSMYRLC
jgi:hypothetical protein